MRSWPARADAPLCSARFAAAAVMYLLPQRAAASGGAWARRQVMHDPERQQRLAPLCCATCAGPGIGMSCSTYIDAGGSWCGGARAYATQAHNMDQ